MSLLFSGLLIAQSSLIRPPSSSPLLSAPSLNLQDQCKVISHGRSLRSPKNLPHKLFRPGRAGKPVEMRYRSVTFRLASSQSHNQKDRQSVSRAAWQESDLASRPSGSCSQRCSVRLWSLRSHSECIILGLFHGQNTHAKWKQ